MTSPRRERGKGSRTCKHGKLLLQGVIVRDATISKLQRGLFVSNEPLPLVCIDVVDEEGIRTTLQVAHSALSDTDTMELQRMYPKGAHIEVLSPTSCVVGASTAAGMRLFVENPSSIHVLSYVSKQMSEILHSMDAVQLRKQGNAEFGKGKYEAAIELYGMAISKALDDDKEALVLSHSNRAECYLLLHLWNEAHEDCCQALRLHPQHIKSIYRLGKALHHMQEYHTACTTLELGEKLDSGNAAIQATLEKSRLFLAQSTSGDYGEFLEEFFMSGSKWENATECSEYLGPVEIRLTPDGKGRGLFATEDIKAGRLVMVCKAFAMARAGNAKKTDVVTKLVRLGMKSKAHLRQLYTLADSDKARADVPPMHLFGPNKTSRRGMLKEEAFYEDDLHVDVQRIYGITSTTSYTLTMAGIDLYTALWVVPGFINNSCIPNMCKFEVGDAAFFHANRDIKAGDELTVGYLDKFLPWSSYRKQRFSKFNCMCQRCKVEARYDKDLRHVAMTLRALGTEKIFNPRERATHEALAELAPEVEKVIQGANEDEKSCVRTSYIAAYMSYHILKSKGAHVPAGEVPSAEVVTRSLRYCAPGEIKTIYLIGLLNGGQVPLRDIVMMIGYDSGKPHVVKEVHRQLQEKTWSWMVPLQQHAD